MVQTTRSPDPTPTTSQQPARTSNDGYDDATQPTTRPKLTTTDLGSSQTAESLSLSTSSVPSLRFPKPQGNRHLANWISRSDPDIMRITTTEEETGLGLADSTYELITTDDADANHASETEIRHKDEVHSITGTDTEEDNVEHHDASDSSDFETEDEDEGEEHGHSPTESVVDLSEPSQQEPEPRSRAHSIEYTERSLQLPSSRSPDEKEAKGESLLDRLMETYQAIRASHFVFRARAAGDHAAASSPLALYSTAVSAAAVLLLVLLFLRPEFPPATYSVAPAVTSTVTFNHTSTRTVTVAPTASAPAPVPAVLTPFNGLLPDLHDFGLRRNMCSAEITPTKEVLVKMPTTIKSAWLAKGAITLSVYRGNEMLKSSFNPTTQGIVIQLDRKDAYGLVNVTVITNRRPYINETFELDFGKGALTEAWEAGVLLVYDLAEQTALAASDRVRDAHTAVRDTVRDIAQTVGSSISNNVASLADDLRQELKQGEERAQVHMQEMMIKGGEVLEEVDMAVLKARIVSRLWFYKMTNNEDKYDEYSAKAKIFLTEKRKNMTLAAQARLAAKDGHKTDTKCQSGFASWAKPECWKGAA